MTFYKTSAAAWSLLSTILCLRSRAWCGLAPSHPIHAHLQGHPERAAAAPSASTGTAMAASAAAAAVSNQQGAGACSIQGESPPGPHQAAMAMAPPVGCLQSLACRWDADTDAWEGWRWGNWMLWWQRTDGIGLSAAVFWRRARASPRHDCWPCCDAQPGAPGMRRARSGCNGLIWLTRSRTCQSPSFCSAMPDKASNGIPAATGPSRMD